MEDIKLNRRAMWTEILESFNQSGQTIKDFSEQRGISYHSLQYWRKRLLLKPGEANPKSSFSRVQVVLGQPQFDCAIKISVGGVVISGQELPSPIWVAGLSRELGI